MQAIIIKLAAMVAAYVGWKRRQKSGVRNKATFFGQSRAGETVWRHLLGAGQLHREDAAYDEKRRDDPGRSDRLS